MLRALLALAVCSALIAADAAKPLLHPLFSDHAVLQRDRPLPVWGWTAPGQEVTVVFAGKAAKAKAGADGRWQVVFDARPAGGDPVAIEVSAGADKAAASDLLLGDVWICSGQSNMEMGIKQAADPAATIAAADCPTLRLCVVEKRHSIVPLETTGISWQVCTPASVATHGPWGGFSAIAYHFGRKLVADTGVPIGLVQTAWGGTSGEAWTSEQGLIPLGDFAPALAELASERSGSGKKGLAEKMLLWWQANDPGTVAGWMKPAFDDGSWKTMTLPQLWEGAGLPDFDGVVWFRRQVEVPADWAGKELSITIQGVDDDDTTFFDGEAVGGGNGWAARDYRITPARATAGSHLIAIRVLDTGGGGGVMSKPENFTFGPVGGANRLPLAGPWRYQAGPAMGALKPQPVDLDKTPGGRQNVATALYNAMLSPLLPASISGVIWYQGEANACNAPQYRRLLPALITDWRKHFNNPEAPFLIVQLAGYGFQGPADWWPDLRWVQAQVANSLPGCGLACAIDIGDGGDIHPKNKKDVGVRLALHALKLRYGKDIESSGPQFTACKVEGDAVRISFSHAAGMRTSDGKAPLAFALATADGPWVVADTAIDGNSVVLRAKGLTAPTRARYAWANFPEVNLINAAGLPAVPFRTDAP